MHKSYWCLLIKSPRRIHKIGQSIAPSSFYGSMQWLNHNLVPFSRLDHINMLMRSISQVAFVNNPLSGLIIATAMLIEDPWLCFIGLWGCLSTTLFAVKCKLDTSSVRNGAIGFSGFLVSCASHLVLSKLGHTFWLSYLLVSTVLSLLNVTLIHLMIKRFVKKTQLPFFTLPYNLSLFTFIGILFLTLSTPFESTTLTQKSSFIFNWSNILQAGLINVAQVYFFQSPFTGLAIILAIFTNSAFATFYTLLGAFIFISTANLLSLNAHVLASGVIGYNAILASVVIGCTYYQVSKTSFAVACLTSFITSIFAIALAHLISPYGIPLLTIPFCLCSILVIYILRTIKLKGLTIAASPFLSAEENLKIK